MEGDQTLLKSIRVETLIPEDGTAQLSGLLEDVSSSGTEAAVGIVAVRRRNLLFVGMTMLIITSRDLAHGQIRRKSKGSGSATNRSL